MRNVLVLCTGNSARSVIGEVLIRDLGGEAYQGFSAGSHPKDAPHPMTLETLAAHGHSLEGLRSKSWDEFTTKGAPLMDIVITVCDSAAAEVCPVWPANPEHGAPVTTHWGVADPAAAEGTEAERRAAFEAAYQILRARVEALIAAPLDGLSREALKGRLDAIGALTPAA